VFEYVVLGAKQKRSPTFGVFRTGLFDTNAKAGGVAEVASVGGFVKQYQWWSILKAARLRHSVSKVTAAIRASNMEVGGSVIEMRARIHGARAWSFHQKHRRPRQIVLKTTGGTPVLLRDVARVELGPDERRGLTELNGLGEVVSGIVLRATEKTRSR